MTVNYTTYLKLDKILDAQEPKSASEHDEMLFIIIHQVYELWFKQQLHEGAALQAALTAGNFDRSLATLSRMLTILKTMVGQTDILETMTPISFSGFRNRLENASGFQSAQFRMFEFFLGNKNPKMIAFHGENTPTGKTLSTMLNAPTLYDSFLAYLAGHGYEVPTSVLKRDYSQPIKPNEAVQDILLKVYRTDSKTMQLCEKLVDLDEGVQEWRYRHVKMVERTIGTKPGTGGSAGVEFLKQSLFKPAFPDLWEVRSRF